MTKREELYLKGMEMIKQFSKLNNIDISDIDFFVRYNKKECPNEFKRWLYTSGLCVYPTKRKNRYKIFVNLPKSACEANKPTPFNSNHVHWFVDRTPCGIVCHEFGHYLHHKLTNLKIVLPKEKQITSYEPNYHERFAESIKLFITNPDLLKQYDPKRYDVIVNKLKLKPIINKTYIEVFKEHNMHEIYYERAQKRIEKEV